MCSAMLGRGSPSQGGNVVSTCLSRMEVDLVAGSQELAGQYHW